MSSQDVQGVAAGGVVLPAASAGGGGFALAGPFKNAYYSGTKTGAQVISAAHDCLVTVVIGHTGGGVGATHITPDTGEAFVITLENNGVEGRTCTFPVKAGTEMDISLAGGTSLEVWYWTLN